MSSTEKYIELLKLQASTSEDPQVAKDAVSTLELYGYKAVPALRDVLATCNDEELRELTAEVLRNLGWDYGKPARKSKDSSRSRASQEG